MRAMRPLLLLGFLLGGAAGAEEPIHRVSLELRGGGQVEHAFPALGFYAAARVAGEWEVGAGYEVVRAFGVTLPTACDAAIDPAVTGGLRAGVWRGFRFAHGLYARGGVLAGAAAFALTPAPLPSDATGAVLEAGLDGEAGWHNRWVRMAVYATPSFAAGSLGSGPVCQARPATRMSVHELSLHLGLAIALTL
jgi:hypothetical protein